MSTSLRASKDLANALNRESLYMLQLPIPGQVERHAQKVTELDRAYESTAMTLSIGHQTGPDANLDCMQQVAGKCAFR